MKEEDEAGNLKRWGSGEARMTGVKVVGPDGQEKRDFTPWEPFEIRIEYEAQRVLDDAVVGLAIYRSDGQLLYGTNTLIDSAKAVTLQKKGRIRLKMAALQAGNGEYAIDLALHRPDGFNYDFWRDICTIRVADKTQTVGEIALQHEWEID